jgi:hypothetical protein
MILFTTSLIVILVWAQSLFITSRTGVCGGGSSVCVQLDCTQGIADCDVSCSLLLHPAVDAVCNLLRHPAVVLACCSLLI